MGEFHDVWPQIIPCWIVLEAGLFPHEDIAHHGGLFEVGSAWGEHVVLRRIAELSVTTFCSFVREFSSAQPASSDDPLTDG